MLQSQLFTKGQKNFPKDEVSLNAKLLTRAGFVKKISAGVYAFLPLGWRVIEHIARIVREEMDAIGGQELFMPALIEKRYLDATDRWKVDIGFEVRGKNEKHPTFMLGWSHEETLAAIATQYVYSYNNLPFAAYQIQTKFRNELRVQSGLLRSKEFLMKDLYSFHVSEEDLFRYYEEVKKAYFNVFRRCGLEPVYTIASGGAFTIRNTHEFQVLADVGEDTILVCLKCTYAENSEMSKRKEGDACPQCGGNVSEKRAIEVGNIFPLGTKYSEAFGLAFVDKDGTKKPVVMGSYGIGISRLMGAVVEIHNDEKGIIWPERVAPYGVHILEIGDVSAKDVYGDLQKEGIAVLYDERNISAGEKFAEADLIGIPWRLVVSQKTGEKVELKRRDAESGTLVSRKEAVKILKS